VSSLFSLYLINPFVISAVPATEYFEGYYINTARSPPGKSSWPCQ